MFKCNFVKYANYIFQPILSSMNVLLYLEPIIENNVLTMSLSLSCTTTCKDRFILFLYHVYIRTKEYKNIGKQIKDTQVSSRENIGSTYIFFPRLSEKKLALYTSKKTPVLTGYFSRSNTINLFILAY